MLATGTLALAGDASSAGSGDPVAAYQDAVAHGQAAFDDGDYEVARASFRTAYEIHAEPVLLFNIASTFRRQGELARAIDLYREFLAVAEPDDPRRLLAAQTIADLEDDAAMAAAVDAIDARADLETPPPVVAAEVEEQVPRPRRSNRPRTDLILRGTGIALGATSIITASLAMLAASDIQLAEDRLESLGSGAAWNDEQQAWYDSGEAAQRRMILWSAASATLLTAGVVVYVVGVRQRDRSRAALTVVPASGGAMMSLSSPW